MGPCHGLHMDVDGSIDIMPIYPTFHETASDTLTPFCEKETTMSSGADVRPGQDRDLSPEMIRRQLERIIESSVFNKSTRLTAFLRFVVEESLARRGDSLKEQVLASELYGRGSDFDSGNDPVVRVDARRLRDKLREYYTQLPADPVIIALPKGSYVPVFERGAAAARLVVIPSPVAAQPGDEVHRKRSRALLLVALGLAALALAVVLHRFWPARGPASELRPMASLPGAKGPPSLSPDGNFVAFWWSGPDGKQEDGVYIKSVDTEDLRLLALHGLDPSWSPDGREIAFHRTGPEQGVYIVSQLGGVDRKVSPSGTNAVWVPDSTALLIRDQEGPDFFRIFSISLKTLERRRLTDPPMPLHDGKLAVSPDGKSLAFIRTGIPGLSDLYVVPITGGEPRRLTNWNSPMLGLTWTPDGREIVYDVEESAGYRLWRIPVNRSAPGRGVRLAEATGD